jgi:acetyl esterase
MTSQPTSQPPMGKMADLVGTAQRLVLTAVLALPTPVQQVLAGRPVVRDGQILDVETQLVLRLQKLLREPGAEEFQIEGGRAVLDAQSRVVAGHQPIGSVEERPVGALPGRVYVPKALLETLGPRPTLVFIHGGGFIYGGLQSHDAVCRVLAERAGVQVVANDYRLAPEHPFPAAYDDCVAAYSWIVEHAAELSADVARLAVGGDSAGGNLAAGVAIEAARSGLPLAFQLLVYPVTDSVTRSASRKLFAEDFYLNQTFMDLAVDSYLPEHDDRKDPRASPLYADLPAGLAPAQVVTAGFDPLRDEGEAYARALADAGAAVDLKRYPGLIHGFLNWVGVGRSARGAVAEIADQLRMALKVH